MPHEQRLEFGARVCRSSRMTPTASFPDHGVYLGSLSKVLTPGCLVAPPSIFPKLL